MSCDEASNVFSFSDFSASGDDSLSKELGGARVVVMFDAGWKSSPFCRSVVALFDGSCSTGSAFLSRVGFVFVSLPVSRDSTFSAPISASISSLEDSVLSSSLSAN